MKLINAWSSTYDKGDVNAGDILLLLKDGDKRYFDHLKNPPWHFFIDKTDKAREVLSKLKTSIKSSNEGKNYIKISVDKKKYKDTSVIELVEQFHSNGVQTYEADLGPAKRLILDKKLEIEDFSKINLMYFDIETDDSYGNIEYEEYNGMQSIKAKDRILSIALVDKKGNEHFFYDEDEREMLLKFNSFLQGVDMLVGWNSKDFDIPYLWKRMQQHKIPNAYMRNILHEDMMKRVQYFYSKDPEARQSIKSYSLDSISKYFLKEGKIERSGKVYDLMKKDFETFKEYNLTDARLLMKLEEKLGLINLTYQMFQMCGVTAQNWSMVKALDNFVLSEANSQGIHYKTNEAYLKEYEENENPEEYLGAFVLDPIPGYYRDVYDLDFKSLYPNIIRSFNISPDTLSPRINGLDLIKTPGVEIDGKIRGECYYDPKQGVIPKKIRLLLEEREKIRSEQKKHKKDSVEYRDLNVKQLVVKELANSIYGIIGNKYYRGFNVDMAESITGTGQYLIKYLQKTFESKGRKVIYGDTDSVFVILSEGEEIREVLDETNTLLSRFLKKEFGVRECTIELDLDKVLSKFLIVSKKKYAGLSEGKIKYVGLECVKRDNIDIATRIQKDLIDRIFKDQKEEQIHAVIRAKRDQIRSQILDPKDLVIHKKMAKDADKYQGKGTKKYTAPIWVRIAKNLKSLKGDKTDLTKGGSIISYIYTNGSTDGVHISQFDGNFDRTHYWNVLIYPQLHRILKSVFPKEDWEQYYEAYSKPVKRRNTKGSVLPTLFETK